MTWRITGGARVVTSADVTRILLGREAQYGVEDMVGSACAGWAGPRPVPRE